jgi:hypothetical protein
VQATTPAREAIERAIAQVNDLCEASVRQGLPQHAADASRALVTATMRQLADQSDARIRMADSLASFQLAFANAITSLVGTLAGSTGMNRELVTMTFVLDVVSRVTEQLQQAPDIVEPVHPGHS